jgi:hypothetical protein
VVLALSDFDVDKRYTQDLNFHTGKSHLQMDVDLLVICESPHDDHFVDLLSQVFQEANPTLLTVCQMDPELKLKKPHAENLRPRVCLDLTAGSPSSIVPIEQWATESVHIHLNPTERRREV